MDGNCLFHCLAAGLKELDATKEYTTAAEIRARVANHFSRNEGEYRKAWDGELPNHAVSDDFKKCVSEIEKDGVWGGLLELRAAARIYDTRLIIFATPVEIEPYARRLGVDGFLQALRVDSTFGLGFGIQTSGLFYFQAAGGFSFEGGFGFCAKLASHFGNCARPRANDKQIRGTLWGAYSFGGFGFGAEPCSYCAHVHVGRTSAILAQNRHRHHRRWHAGTYGTCDAGASA
eukprot:s6297_g2.t1